MQVDNYDDLPLRTAFVQADIAPANERKPRFLEWLRCSRQATGWAPLNDTFVANLSVEAWRLDKVAIRSTDANRRHRADPLLMPVVEQCWRDLLAVFGQSSQLPSGELNSPRVSFFPNSNFHVSREQLRKHSKGVYEEALGMMLGGSRGRPPGACNAGPLEAQKLSAASQRQLALARRAEGGLAASNCIVAARGIGANQVHVQCPRFNKHASSGGFEHLHHVLLGGQPMQPSPPDAMAWCGQYHAAGEEGCEASPCKLAAPPPPAELATVVRHPHGLFSQLNVFTATAKLDCEERGLNSSLSGA